MGVCVCVGGGAHIGICGQAWINKANKGRYVWLIYITDGAGYLNPCKGLNSIGKGGMLTGVVEKGMAGGVVQEPHKKSA